MRVAACEKRHMKTPHLTSPVYPQVDGRSRKPISYLQDSDLANKGIRRIVIACRFRENRVAREGSNEEPSFIGTFPGPCHIGLAGIPCPWVVGHSPRMM
jgi:hypothetical protein